MEKLFWIGLVTKPLCWETALSIKLRMPEHAVGRLRGSKWGSSEVEMCLVPLGNNSKMSRVDGTEWVKGLMVGCDQEVCRGLVTQGLVCKVRGTCGRAGMDTLFDGLWKVGCTVLCPAPSSLEEKNEVEWVGNSHLIKSPQKPLQLLKPLASK